MSHVQKIRIIIEGELRERGPNPSGQPSPDVDPTEYGYEQALYAALRADPERYAAFVKTRVIGVLEGLGVNNSISHLAQINDSYTAGIQVLESLLPTLPKPARHYLQKALNVGYIMDDPDSIYNTLETELLQLTVEYYTPND